MYAFREAKKYGTTHVVFFCVINQSRSRMPSSKGPFSKGHSCRVVCVSAAIVKCAI
jgi:hypothetical protein